MHLFDRGRAILVAAGLVAALAPACDASSVGPTGRPTETALTHAPPTASPAAPSRREAQAEDARYLVAQMKQLHPDLYHGVARALFERAARSFVDAAPTLTPEQFLVEVMRIVALPSLRGRDGHSGVFPMHEGATHAFPIRLYDFTDGLFVVDALPPYRQLVGAEIVAVEDTPLGLVRKRLEPLVSRDNASTVRARFPTTFVTSEVLEGIGVATGPRPKMTLRYPSGRTVTRRLEPIPMHDYLTWIGARFLWSLPSDPKVLYLSRMEREQWVRYLPRERIVYAQYNVVEYPGTIMDGIEEALGRGARKVVLDLRHNGGGDNTTYSSLVDLLSRRRIEREVRLYVIAGRTTFSAAGNLVGEIAQETNAMMVGEPSGGSPNQYGDQQLIKLPHSGINAYVPVYFVEAVPGDNRAAIQPDIPATLSSSAYFGRRDPALEAIVRD
jgi:hypothetical protein